MDHAKEAIGESAMRGGVEVTMHASCANGDWDDACDYLEYESEGQEGNIFFGHTIDGEPWRVCLIATNAEMLAREHCAALRGIGWTVSDPAHVANGWTIEVTAPTHHTRTFAADGTMTVTRSPR